MSLLALRIDRYNWKRVAASSSLPALLGVLAFSIFLFSGSLVSLPGSPALAELIARSPGMRIGGIALKSKSRRAMVSPVAGDDTDAPGKAPRSALASVLGVSDEGEEGPLAQDKAPEDISSLNDLGDGTTPPDAPSIGSPAGTGDAPPGTVDGSSSPPLFSNDLPPPSGGTGGTGSPPSTIVDQPLPPIPEPATWLMLIVGFGGVGQSLRGQRRRARFA